MRMSPLDDDLAVGTWPHSVFAAARYNFPGSLLYSRNFCNEDPPHRGHRILRDVLLLLEVRPAAGEASAAGDGDAGVPLALRNAGPGSPRPYAVLMSLAEAEAIRASMHALHPALQSVSTVLRVVASGNVLDAPLVGSVTASIQAGDTTADGGDVASDMPILAQPPSVQLWRQCARFFNADVWFTAGDTRVLLAALSRGSVAHRRAHFKYLLECRRRQQQEWTGSMLELGLILPGPTELDVAIRLARSVLARVPKGASLRQAFSFLDVDSDGFLSEGDLRASSLNAMVRADETHGVEQLASLLALPGSSGVAFSTFAVLVMGFVTPARRQRAASPRRHTVPAVAAPDRPEHTERMPSANLCPHEATSGAKRALAVRFVEGDNGDDDDDDGGSTTTSLADSLSTHGRGSALPPSPRSRFLRLSRQISGSSNLRKALRVLSQLDASKLGQVRGTQACAQAERGTVSQWLCCHDFCRSIQLVEAASP